MEKWPHLPVEGVASGDRRKPSQKDTGIGTIAALAHVKAPIPMDTVMTYQSHRDRAEEGSKNCP